MVMIRNDVTVDFSEIRRWFVHFTYSCASSKFVHSEQFEFNMNREEKGKNPERRTTNVLQTFQLRKLFFIQIHPARAAQKKVTEETLERAMRERAKYNALPDEERRINVYRIAAINEHITNLIKSLREY